MTAVVVERDGPVATITLNRPERKNALNADGWRLLHEAVSAVNEPSVRVVVLTGAGGEFCAGADVSGPRSAAHPLDRMARVTAPLVALHELPKPVIAKVDGVAVGAGWSLALACDLVVASTRARFSQIFARRGLSLDCGASWLLPRLVGLHTAKRLAFLAEMIGAEEATRLGLVTHLVEPDGLDATVGDLAAALAQGPPVAIAQDKALLHAAHGRTFRAAIEAENAAQAINFVTDAPVARAAAKGEQPRFTGEWRA